MLRGVVEVGPIVEALVREHHPDVAPSAACFFRSVYGATVLQRQFKTRVLLQAGSAQWPRVTPAQDDGVCMTHFGYVWSPGEPPSVDALRAGTLPEMHVWLAEPQTQTLIDFSAGDFPAQAKALCGYDWPGRKPPRVFCGKRPPCGVVYEPHIQAIKFALALVPFAIPGGDRILNELVNGVGGCAA